MVQVINGILHSARNPIVVFRRHKDVLLNGFMAAGQTLECSYSNCAWRGTMASITGSLKAGRLKDVMSMIEISGLGVAGEVRRTL